MNLNGNFSCALGWERWWLDWYSLQCNGVNSDVTGASQLPSNGTFTLRDFITTGDMVRIRIPDYAGSGVNQYLWIENHQGISEFDSKTSQTNGYGNPFPSSPKGIIAYIETISDDKSSPHIFTSGANGIKALHAKGNFDYTFDPVPSRPCELWNNYAYNFSEVASNPISGQNRVESIRNDYFLQYLDASKESVIDYTTTDGHIDVNTGPNNSSGDNKLRNEGSPVVERNGIVTLDNMGQDMAFIAGQKMGMARNPCINNRPQYDRTSSKMGAYYLNGISVKTLSYQSNGYAEVQVAFSDVDIDQNIRWAGSTINLPNITGDANPDVNVLSGVTVTIDKSGTPNRHTKTASGDFINPTVFTCQNGSYYKMQTSAQTNVINSSALILESGSIFEINDGAVLKIESGSTFHVKSGANLVIKGSGRIDVESGAYMCIESGATLNLQDALSAINLHTGFNYGVNTSVLTDPGTCLSSNSLITKTGSGSINLFSSDVYIQNITLSTNHYYSGNNIFAGSNVTTANPPGTGNVLIQSGAKVILDADGNILLDKGFEVQLGAYFEAK